MPSIPRLPPVELICAGLLLCLACANAWAQAFRYDFEIVAPEPYKTLLAKNIDLARWRDNPLMDEAQLQRLAGRAPEEIRRALETEGYYSPRIVADPLVRRDDGSWFARYTVDPGVASTVSKTQIDLSGAITQTPGKPSPDGVRASWPLKPGTRFRHAEWETAKSGLLREITSKRYLGARLKSSRADVDPVAHLVDLLVDIDSGPVFKLGATQVEGLERYPRSIVDHLNPLREGEEYDLDNLLKFQSRLQDSGYFAVAGVSAQPDPEHPDTATVNVRVDENKLQTVGFGVGYSTNTGARGQIDYQHNNVFDQGWRSVSALKIETKAQSLQSDLYMPVNALGQRYSVGTKLERTDLNGVVSRTFSTYGKRADLRGDIETQLSLGYWFEHLTIEGSEDEINRALVPNYSWTVHRVQPALYPERGYQLNIQLGGATRALASTQDWVRGYLRAIDLIPVSEKGTVTIRGETGVVVARSRSGIPSDFLFRTGGDTSVRGYSYESLGVPQGNAIVGGRVLLVGSAEYTYWFRQQWGAAVFADAGDAADNRETFKIQRGYGVGARWRSPLGPFNMDVAYGEATHSVRLHFSVGLAF